MLDTWFSSALWPFATLGWPDETPELAAYYPGNVNSTAREIIRLWENRMIWTGLEVMGEVPFTDVIIHSTVLAADGRRMSKSLGTGVDPIEMIDAHGADATRYGLLKISSTQDVRFSPGAIEEGRKLANKLWNVSRLILQNAEGIEAEVVPTALEERWILARIEAARTQIEEAWEAFDFATATNVLYHLTFDDFCDWYAEAVKPRLYEHEHAACATALAALERLLALLHPVVPHVTEEIWSHLPGTRNRLIVSSWPSADDRFDADCDALERVQEAAVTFRRSGVQVVLATDDERRVFAAVVRPERQKQPGDVGPEIARLQKEIARAEAMLANERFVGSAPPEVVDGEREKLERFKRELEALACDRELARGGRGRLARRTEPLARGRFRARADDGLARCARQPADALSGDSRCRNQREVDGDGDDRAVAPRRRHRGRLHCLAAHSLLGRADSGRRSARRPSRGAAEGQACC